jgi:uncharacterized protein (UPF0335 family)
MNLPEIPSSKTLEKATEQVREIISKILPLNENDIEENIEEIWKDLSSIYFKYDDESQKMAFRKVLMEIYAQIKEGRWDEIYRKIYGLNKKRT